MLDAVFSFFSSFNPIAFGVVFSAGIIILVQRPARLRSDRPETSRFQALRAVLRREP
ncbi:MAG: hypothetical protein JWO42_1745 [Chloroflexi bacterium]|jgi:hypothetical protein|nr:hypothetical protein [Chloroflexota bacterium]